MSHSSFAEFEGIARESYSFESVPATHEGEIQAESILASRFEKIVTRQPTSGARPKAISPLIHELKLIFHDEVLCKQLMNCQVSDAQLLLDSFQQLLDRTDLDLPFRKDLIIATQRLSSKAGLAPTWYKLKGVTQVGEDPVAAGGVADIYKGKFRGQAVCLKTVRLYQATHIDHMIKKFWKEAILWGQLSDPNVLAIYGLYLHKNRVCIVSPWMKNEEICSYLKKHPDAPRVRLAMDVGSGLRYLHDNDIIHGDLKSPNVLVDGAGRARLADFGISSVLDASIVAWTTQPTDVSKGGTVRWRAPEVLRATSSVLRNTKESDVYSWGCVALEIFTGQIPFHEFVNDAVTFKVVSGARPMRPDPSGPSWKMFGLTEEIWACMEQCWEKEPSQRPSASTIVQRLNASTTTADPRRSPEADRLLPSEFRREMNRGYKMITKKELNRIVSQKVTQQEDTREEWSSARGGHWIKEIKPDDDFIKNARSGDVIIPVMGPTGAGKSTFINTLLGRQVTHIGHKLQSETEHVHAYPFSVDSTRTVFIVDTPGFDDTCIDDREILRRVAVWMAKSYKDDMKVAGIIYLHEITQTRMTGVMRKNLDLFEKLCGPHAASSIVLATTKWSEVLPQVGEQRENQLRKEHWKDMLADGSRMRRFDGSQESAQTIVDEILVDKALDAIQVQLELVKIDKLLAETEAGRSLRCTLKVLLGQQKQMAAQLRQKNGGDHHGSDSDIRSQVVENDKKLRSLITQIDDLRIPLGRRIMHMVGLV